MLWLARWGKHSREATVAGITKAWRREDNNHPVSHLTTFIPQLGILDGPFSHFLTATGWYKRCCPFTLICRLDWTRTRTSLESNSVFPTLSMHFGCLTESRIYLTTTLRHLTSSCFCLVRSRTWILWRRAKHGRRAVSTAPRDSPPACCQATDCKFGNLGGAGQWWTRIVALFPYVSWSM